MKHPSWTSLLVALGAALIFTSARAKADIQTALVFTSPSSIQAGGSVTFDFELNFIPLPATTGAPSFTDTSTGKPVASCSTDPNPCFELQFNTTASILVPNSNVFAEALATTTPTQIAPTFFPFSSLGTFPITLTYPDPGRFETTTAGVGDQEEFSELECLTP